MAFTCKHCGKSFSEFFDKISHEHICGFIRSTLPKPIKYDWLSKPGYGIDAPCWNSFGAAGQPGLFGK